MSSKLISISDFCEILGVEALSPKVMKAFRDESPIIFRDLTTKEVRDLRQKIKDKIFNPNTNQAGPQFKKNWEANWNQNLENFKVNPNESSLIPNFISNTEPMRFKGKYILPLVSGFEMKVVRILRTFVFEKYFENINSLHEFGAGTGFNLLQFGKMYPDKKLYGYDWSISSKNLISLAGKRQELDIKSIIFDMFEPNFDLRIDVNSGLLTVGALEQLGEKWDKFLMFMIQKRFSIYVHIETDYEANKKNKNSFNQLACEYIERRNWLRGFFGQLEQLKLVGDIEIIQKATVIGSMFHDSWTVTVWKLKNV